MLSSNTSSVSGDTVYVEDVFSTRLYTGNGSTQTLTNGIDLAGKGGMVWLKVRSGTTGDHEVFDTLRGATNWLIPNATNAQITDANTLTAFNTNGFSIGNYSEINGSGNGMVSWTFRKQPKFFDVVTYTGNGTSGRTIAHSLGSVPGCIIVKNTSNTADWAVYHRSLGSTKYITLNATDAAATSSAFWNNTDPTSTNFTVGSGGHQVNWNGETYVAYIFAHDAGGFGLTGTDNVISCGSFANNNYVNLGYEPQWVMLKRTDSTSNWFMHDNMRGFPASPASNSALLRANTSDAEVASTWAWPDATGFTPNVGGAGTWIYIAIRRGPMKVPTDGTTVYQTSSRSSTAPAWTSGFPVDWFFQRTTSSDNWATLSRLTGTNQLRFNTTDAATEATEFKFDWMNGVNGSLYNASNDRGWMFKRAPSFFDEVCYTGTGSATTFSHNLGVAPELMIVKERDVAGAWRVYVSSLGNTNHLVLNSDGQVNGGDMWNSTNPTSTVFSVGTSYSVNRPAGTFVNYLFATCAGVSKVGSYTGNGSSQTIACGFAAGARFVMIKRTDSTGNWYVWDTARGIVSGNDPYLSLNTTAAEVTTDDTIDPDSSGFIVNQLSATNVNVSSATYIYLAIA